MRNPCFDSYTRAMDLGLRSLVSHEYRERERSEGQNLFSWQAWMACSNATLKDEYKSMLVTFFLMTTQSFSMNTLLHVPSNLSDIIRETDFDWNVYIIAWA